MVADQMCPRITIAAHVLTRSNKTGGGTCLATLLLIVGSSRDLADRARKRQHLRSQDQRSAAKGTGWMRTPRFLSRVLIGSEITGVALPEHDDNSWLTIGFPKRKGQQLVHKPMQLEMRQESNKPSSLSGLCDVGSALAACLAVIFAIPISVKEEGQKEN